MSLKGELAKTYFKEGYNCAQSIALAFCDEIGIEKTKLLRMVSSFGGGMGRLREAVSYTHQTLPTICSV